MTPQRFKLSVFQRRFPRLDNPTSLRSTRLEVRPPSLRHAPSSFWQRVVFWIMAPEPMDAAPPLNRLPIAVHRSEFEAAQRLARLNHHFPVRAPRNPPLLTVQ